MKIERGKTTYKDLRQWGLVLSWCSRRDWSFTLELGARWITFSREK